MKAIRILLMAGVAGLAVIGLSPVYAFHSGGVAECGGCHSMHDAASNPLLQKGDPSSTCLNCHEHAGDTGPSSYHISSAVVDMPDGVPPKQRGPAGDFGWLKKNYTYTLRGTPTTDFGYTHGHNIVATDFGYVADPVNTTAPGGTMPSNQLSCVSCHDPHDRTRRLNDGTLVSPNRNQGQTYAPIMGSGSYGLVPPAGLAAGVYRILGDVNYVAFDNTTFPGVPSAVTPSTYNRTELATQTRTAYGHATTGGYASWGQWCATCHPNMHSNNNALAHPVDQALGTTISNNYNAYLKTGDLTGTPTTSFNSLVPFTESTSDVATLAAHAKTDDSYLNGPASSDGVDLQPPVERRERVRHDGRQHRHGRVPRQGRRGQHAGRQGAQPADPDLQGVHGGRDAGRVLRPAGDQVRRLSAPALQQVSHPGLIVPVCRGSSLKGGRGPVEPAPFF